tara:strand:+ start:1187 stop:1399 length:213 start_codon:yes stop_codon:yes gene_type:complete
MNIYIPELLIQIIASLSFALMLLAFFVLAIGFLTDILEKYLKLFFKQLDVMEFRPVFIEWVKNGKPKVSK